MTKEFLQKLSELQASISVITKNTDNPYFKSHYADLNALFAEIKPLIKEHGFILMQTVHNNILHTELTHIELGESVSEDMELLACNDMQKLGSAITYARRYSILPLLNIETVDDDGNLASGKTKTWDELKTVEDFEGAIKSCSTVQQLNALYYKWSAVYNKGTAEFNQLNRVSGDMKIQIQNPDLKVNVR